MLPTIHLGPSLAPDSDTDGLPDDGELIAGTDPGNPDSDGDGISDGAEIQQGTNPLDGLAVATGIIATVDTPGTAVDVAVRNDIAIVADSDRGISVMNVAAGLNPVIIAQVDTPGTAQAVAFEDTLVAVADGPAGLAIVDIGDPPAARIVRQLDSFVLGGEAISVTVAGGTAYVGLTTNKIVAVDLATGAVTETVSLPTIGALQDLAIERDTLYALTTGLDVIAGPVTVGQLHAIPLQSPLQVTSSVTSPEFGLLSPDRRFRLFAGGGIAYAMHTSGYNTFNLATPTQPVLIAAGNTQQFGWRQIVANGSGLGLAAVSPNGVNTGPHNVSLYDTSDSTQTNQFLTEFETPGFATAVSIYNGIGYVADGQAGLQVVNYRSYDANGVAPTIALDSNYPLSGPTGRAEEGHLMRLTALVGDDVQVRNVEFFVNGALAARDGNFPFEHRFVTPLLGAVPSFTVRACAFDTGGNRACTQEVTVTLVADATPPTVTTVTPPNGSVHLPNTLTSLSATFRETIDTSTLTPSTFQVSSAGSDNQLGTLDDVSIVGGNISYNPQSATAVLSFSSALPLGNYRAVVRGTVSDLSGNALGTDYTWTFSVRAEKRWISDVSGSWHTASNWSDNEVPLPGDVVVIDRPAASLTVAYESGALSLTSLQSTELLAVSGGALSLESSSNLGGGLMLSGGTLSGVGAITANSFAWSAGTLEGPGMLTVAGDTTIASEGRKLIANKTLTLGSSTTWSGTISWSGHATIVNPPGGTWEVQDDTSFQVGFAADIAAVLNAGIIRKSQGAGTASLSWVVNNSGTIEVLSGTLILGGAFGNSISSGAFLGAAGTTLRLGGTLEPASRVSSRSTVEFGGETAVGGSFNAGTVVVTGGSGVTFTGTIGTIGSLTIPSGATVVFNTAAPVSLDFLTLGPDGGTLRGSAPVTTQHLTWSAPATIDVAALTVVGQAALTGGHLFPGTTLTLGSSTTWGGTALWSGRVTIVNPSGGTWQVQDNLSFAVGFGLDVSTILNAGIIRKSQGAGTASLPLAVNNSGTIEVQSGTLSLGTFFGGTSSGTFIGAAGTTLVLSGTLEPGSQVSSVGTVEFTGTAAVGGGFSAANVLVEGGSATFSGTVGTIGDLTIGGTVPFGIVGGFATFNTGTPVTLGTLTLVNGQIESTSAVTTGSFDWSAGFLRMPALTVTGRTAFQPFVGGFAKTIDGTTLMLGSATTWADGVAVNFSGNASIVNPSNGTWELQGDASIVPGFGTGSLTVANAGLLQMTGPPARFNVAADSFANSGTIVLRLSNLGQFDRLNVNGVATFGGTLDVRLVNGFLPSSSDSFDVLTYGSRSGEFATIESNGETFIATYGPSSLTLKKP